MNNPHGRPPLSGREKFALTVASVVVLSLSIAVMVYFIKHKPKPERRARYPLQAASQSG